jgi:hypothetical protein
VGNYISGKETAPMFGLGEYHYTPDHLCVVFWKGNVLYDMLDIRKTDIIEHRWLVSQKRTKNLFDFASLWKRTLLL